MNIDFHAHILPGADHGCKDLSMSMHQLALAQKAGIDKIVATPHFYPQNESCADFLIRREKAYSQLLSQTKGKPLPEVVLGAEVQLQLGLDRIENLDQLCIRGTNVLLLELPQKNLEVVALRIYAEMSFKQVAESMGISESSAKVLYFRAKNMLKEKLEHEYKL